MIGFPLRILYFWLSSSIAGDNCQVRSVPCMFPKAYVRQHPDPICICARCHISLETLRRYTGTAARREDTERRCKEKRKWIMLKRNPALCFIQLAGTRFHLLENTVHCARLDQFGVEHICASDLVIRRCSILSSRASELPYATLTLWCGCRLVLLRCF